MGIATYIQNPAYDPRLSLKTQRGLPLKLANEDPVVDSGLNVSPASIDIYIVFLLATPLLQPALRDQPCSATLTWHASPSRVGEWTICNKLISLG